MAVQYTGGISSKAGRGVLRKNSIKEERLARELSAASQSEILRLLAEKQYWVKEIASVLNIYLSLASKHLALIYERLVEVRREAVFKCYSFRIKELQELL